MREWAARWTPSCPWPRGTALRWSRTMRTGSLASIAGAFSAPSAGSPRKASMKPKISVAARAARWCSMTLPSSSGRKFCVKRERTAACFSAARWTNIRGSISVQVMFPPICSPLSCSDNWKPPIKSRHVAAGFGNTTALACRSGRGNKTSGSLSFLGIASIPATCFICCSRRSLAARLSSPISRRRELPAFSTTCRCISPPWPANTVAKQDYARSQNRSATASSACLSITISARQTRPASFRPSRNSAPPDTIMELNPTPASRESYDPAFFETLFQAEDKHFWFRARNRVIRAIVRQLIASFPSGYRVLEVGCVTGMDLFEEGLCFARRRTTCPLVVGDVHTASFPHKLHLVGLFDVLEHLPDDEQVLRDLNRFLLPGG